MVLSNKSAKIIWKNFMELQPRMNDKTKLSLGGRTDYVERRQAKTEFERHRRLINLSRLEEESKKMDFRNTE